ncbi:MAG TPA: hypothetical protein DEW46_07975 [Verrucomicrobia bacterium]|jgi:trk system potassium uptake protein TrkH|nr:hypothetical protein [Verrucomicrobiota bacterium]
MFKKRKTMQPAKFVLAAFGSVILLGAALLRLDISLEPGYSLSWVDAIFTATSATCVTGLVVTDTASTFSSFGEGIILLLIQIGALGITTMSTLFLLLLGERPSVQSEIIVEDTLGRMHFDIRSVLFYTASLTLILELVGVLLLTPWLYFSWHMELGQAFYQALFHTVSAYCNAGFSLYADSLTRFRGDPYFLTVIMLLIVLGGLGFVALLNLMQFFLGKRDGRRGPRPRIQLHTQVVLIVTFLLIFAGTIVFLPLEWSNEFVGLSTLDRWVNAMFQSVTSRTAGFNTIDLGNSRSATLLFTGFLMSIGGSPGSAAGGIKTTTFFILILVVRAFVSRRDRIVAFGWTIPNRIVQQAFALFFVAVAWTFSATFLLLCTETGMEITSQQGLLARVLFEVLSAFGTVGLSTGITSGFSTMGKIILLITMFAGRVGPLTLVLGMSRPDTRRALQYPEGKISIG